MKKYLCLCAALCAMLLCCSLISGCGNGTSNENGASAKLELPWENGGKHPSNYTWEEFEHLDGRLRVAFQQSFGSMDAFNQWMMTVKGVSMPATEPGDEIGCDLELPWENGGKQPSDYTWEEFEALEGGQQIAFQQSFDSYEAFERWMQMVNGGQSQAVESAPVVELELPWENGGKQPYDYTWEEFEALEGGQQIAFQQSFDSFEDFEAWMQKQGNPGAGETEPTEEETALELPWENGGKHPSEYTWEEFEALDGGQQIAFQQIFGSIEAFDEWLQRVNP